MITTVRNATRTFFGAPKVGVTPGVPPPAQRMATGSSEMPITVITTPVTTSGKKCSSWVKTGAIRNAITPASSSAPKIARSPSCPAALGHADRQHGRHRGERGALHDRLTGADLPHAEGLQQRRHARHEQPADTRKVVVGRA